MLEYLNINSWARIEKNKIFMPTSKLLQEISESMLRTIDFNPELGSRLLYLSHQKPTSEVKFEAIQSSKAHDCIDFAVNDNGALTPIFTLGVGETSVFFVNTFTQTDRMVYKAKPKGEVTSLDGFIKTIENFIMTDPKDGEITDISREALEKRMNERKVGPTADFSGFTRLKR